jgi:hypothetical protein
MQNATIVIAFPRETGSKISPRAAGTLLIGAEANIPPKKRVRKIAVALRLVAVPILNNPRMKMAGNMPIRRP